ncbi:MAG TPA: YtxH domain-containing protein [Candidatus Angelobacter sp.]
MHEGERQREEEYESLPSEFTEPRSIGRAIALVLAGIGIGAGLALLLTPRRGEEVRDAIGRGYRKTVAGLSERAHDLREDLRERAHDLKADLQERAPKLLRFARHRVDRRFRES